MSEQETAATPEEIQELFVQTAHGAEHTDGRLVLRNVAPSTLFFSDRPQRIVGHLSTQEFVETWGEGDDSFASDPPNAVLSFIATGEMEPWNAVIEISDPMIAGSDLSYAAKVLEGSLPTAAEGCTLFIDPIGRPLSPVSLAGMNRRGRRRARRY
jgi:hypothetical protein